MSVEQTPNTGPTLTYSPPPEAQSAAAPRTDPPTILAPNIAPVEAAPGDATLVPGYQVLEELGRGGMGVVYKAKQVALNRLVALKMILAGPHAAGAVLARFKAEAATIAQLHHPNIVQIYDVGEHEGRPYFSLELVEGGSLAQRVAGMPQAPRAAARMVEVLARAMHQAHEAGIVHRDLKPANVLLQPDNRPPAGASRSFSRGQFGASTDYGTPKITDFGLAKNISASQMAHTHTGSVMGTPSYMSPEQALGENKEVGPAADTYALGAILYELLTGRPPFRADTPINTLLEVIKGEPVPPRRLLPKVPRDLDTIALKCLEREPAKRYPSALHLADDLQRYVDNLPIAARPAGTFERAVKWAKRRPTLAALFATVAVAAVALVTGGVWAYAAVTHRATVAEDAKKEAVAAVEDGRQQLVRLCVANGARQLDIDDLYGSLLWFTEALRLDEVRPERETVHRKRIGSVLERCPRLTQVWAHDGPVHCVAVTPDGRRVVTAGDDGIARVWDAVGGLAVTIPLEHGGPVTTCLFSPDGTRLLTAGPDGNARIWEVETGRRLRTIPVGVALSAAAFHPDGKRFVLATRGGGLRVWDADTSQPASPILTHNGGVTALAFNADATLLLSASRDGTARVWVTATYAASAPTLRHAGAVLSACFSPDGRRVATGGADGVAQVWDARTGERLLARPPQAGGAVNRVAFSPDGSRIVTASDGKSAQVWDAATGAAAGMQMRHGSRVTDAAFSPDGRWVATISDDDSARVWDATTSQPVSAVLRHNGSPLAVTLSPDGRGILTGNQDGLARFWMLRSPPAAGKAATPHEPGAAPPVSSLDGTRVVTFGGESFARVRRADNREPVTPPLRHDGPVTAAAFSPSGDAVATAGADGVVQVWSVPEGKPRWDPPARHASKVYAVAFSPDGRRVASGGDDNTALLLDAATGRPTVPPIRCEGGVFHVAFGARGDTLFTASLDGTSRVWDVATGDPLTPPLPPWDGRPWHDDLPADGRPIRDLVRLARVLTGQQIDKSGGLARLPAAKLREQWAELRDKYPADFTAPKGEAAAWHETQAAAAESAGQWFAAAWHLGRLAEVAPDREDLGRRQAKAYAALGAWERSAAEATKAIELNPASWEAWQRRGLANGELKRWPEATADLAQAYALANEPERRPVQAALMKLAAGDAAGYRQACAELLAKSGPSTDGPAARWVAWVCCLAPDAVPDPKAVVALAERALVAAPRRPAALATLGAALLRAGNAGLAVARLREAIALDPDAPTAWLFLALAEQRRGRATEAAQALAEAALGREGRPRSWQQQVELRVLRAEAEAAVKKSEK